MSMTIKTNHRKEHQKINLDTALDPSNERITHPRGLLTIDDHQITIMMSLQKTKRIALTQVWLTLIQAKSIIHLMSNNRSLTAKESGKEVEEATLIVANQVTTL